MSKVISIRANEKLQKMITEEAQKQGISLSEYIKGRLADDTQREPTIPEPQDRNAELPEEEPEKAEITLTPEEIEEELKEELKDLKEKRKDTEGPYICGNCGYSADDKFDKCPNCGAKLKWD